MSQLGVRVIRLLGEFAVSGRLTCDPGLLALSAPGGEAGGGAPAGNFKDDAQLKLKPESSLTWRVARYERSMMASMSSVGGHHVSLHSGDAAAASTTR